MNHDLIDRCPFRDKTASRRLYLTLARSEKPLTKGQIAKSAHLTVEKTATLLAAYVNPMHKAPLDRVGVRLVRSEEGRYALESCKPKPNARRPARGEPKPVVKMANAKSRRAKSKEDNNKSNPKKQAARATAVEAPGETPQPPLQRVSEAGVTVEAAN